jgi:hypothetical protein
MQQAALRFVMQICSSVNRLQSSKLVAVHKKTMTLLSQLINLRCTTRPSDPCLLDISCYKLLIGEAIAALSNRRAWKRRWKVIVLFNDKPEA